MEEVWQTVLSESADFHSIINQYCNTPESTQSLLDVIKRWISKIHAIEEETQCWKFLPNITRSVKQWTQVEFIIRAALLRSSFQELKSLIVIVISEMVAQYEGKAEGKCGHVLGDLLIETEEDTDSNSLLLLVDSMSLIFPLCGGVCRDIFVSTDFQNQLSTKLNLNEPKLVEHTLLLLAVACIDDSIRTFIAENYLDILEESYLIDHYRVLSALVLVKIWSFTKLKKATLDNCVKLFIDSVKNNEYVNESLEALAYLTLKASVRNLIRSDGDLCLKLVELIKDNKVLQTELYGVLIMISNLSELPTAKEEPVEKLRASLKQNKDGEESTTENIEEIKEFNRDYAIDLDVIGCLKKKSLSNLSYTQLIKIVYNLTRDQDLITQCVKQGAAVMVLTFLAQKKDVAKDDWYLCALRSLTKILIHTDPQTAFNMFSPLNAVPFLFEMMPSSKSNLTSGIQYTTLDTYEALLALTNLATINEGKDLGQLVVSRSEYWDSIEALMLDSTTQIQRSTLELIANLMVNPMAIAVKFFNFENPKSFQNFQILVRLLELHDLKSQVAVAAIFANISSIVPFVAEELAKNELLVKTATKVFVTQLTNSDLRDRLLVLFYSLSKVDNNILTKDAKLLKALEKCQKDSAKESLPTELSTEIIQSLK